MKRVKMEILSNIEDIVLGDLFREASILLKMPAPGPEQEVYRHLWHLDKTTADSHDDRRMIDENWWPLP